MGPGEGNGVGGAPSSAPTFQAAAVEVEGVAGEGTEGAIDLESWRSRGASDSLANIIPDSDPEAASEATKPPDDPPEAARGFSETGSEAGSEKAGKKKPKKKKRGVEEQLPGWGREKGKGGRWGERAAKYDSSSGPLANGSDRLAL